MKGLKREQKNAMLSGDDWEDEGVAEEGSESAAVPMMPVVGTVDFGRALPFVWFFAYLLLI